jgi:MFS family permease
MYATLAGGAATMRMTRRAAAALPVERRARDVQRAGAATSSHEAPVSDPRSTTTAPEPAAALPVRMTAQERAATAGLAGLYGLRMFGMFIILPVFALYAQGLPGGDDQTLVGIALGIYGLTQAVLQVPFGYASDRFGRTPAIVVGLLLFAAGSFVAAAAPDIGWTIAGRALQGAGAISAAVIALAADLTRDSVRTKAMAAIGMTIGATFALSLIAGPLLQRWIGVPGIFVLTGVLALAAIVVLHAIVPRQAKAGGVAIELGDGVLRGVLAHRQLARLNYGIFALHAVLMALFVQVPFSLRDAGLAPARHWLVYLPVVLASVALMWPALRLADRAEHAKPVFLGGIVVLTLALLMLAFAGVSLPALVVSLMVFFAAFNLLEATLPSLVSKMAPASVKGTAVGVYSSVQFLGAFVGASVGGFLSQHAGPAALFGFCVLLTLGWLAAGASMAIPAARSSSPHSTIGET